MGQFASENYFIISFKFYSVVGNVNYFVAPHTTLSNTTHYIVVRSGFVVSFVSNLKMKPSGHSFWCGFPIFHFAHKTSFFDLVFRFSTLAHNLVFGRTHYFVFQPHALLCFSVSHNTSYGGFN